MHPTDINGDFSDQLDIQYFSEIQNNQADRQQVNSPKKCHPLPLFITRIC